MKYHSTADRRDYMNMLGLGGTKDEANVSAFHDLDEAIASPIAVWKRPWWVRYVDKPTIEIDWDNMQRFDGRKIQQVSWAKYVGEHVAKRLGKLKADRMKQWMLENRPSYTLRDRALDIGSRVGRVRADFSSSGIKPPVIIKPVWENQYYRQKAFSPEEMGVPRWEGRPEENARMIRVALRHYGADQVGFVELDEHNRKLIYSIDGVDGKALEFEDVDVAYETDQKRVIPNRARWAIIFSVQLSEELIKRTAGGAPTALSASTTGIAYARANNIIERLQTFLYVLGYQGLMGPWVNGLGIAPALGVMAGLGELSRLNKMISPEYGPLQRVFKVITDLPLSPTRPIDAGIMRFCRICKRCAESCKARALSMESEPSWEVEGPWNNPGHRAYFQDSTKCNTWWQVSTAGCATCLAVCPFSRKDKSFIHKIVAPTISVTPILNDFFTRMHSVFGYGQPKDPESWWDINLPPHGVNSVKNTKME